jgi:hypothetical protein
VSENISGVWMSLNLDFSSCYFVVQYPYDTVEGSAGDGAATSFADVNASDSTCRSKGQPKPIDGTHHTPPPLKSTDSPCRHEMRVS